MNPWMETIALSDYKNVERMLCGFGWRYMWAFNWEWDEAMSTIHSLYVDAREEYDPDRGMKFSTWIFTQVRRRLLTEIYKKKPDCVEIDWELFPAKGEPSFSLPDFIESLSEEAKEVCRLAIAPPIDVKWEAEIGYGGATIGNFKKAIYRHLRTIGWSMRQVQKAFQEIQDALYYRN